MAVVDLIPICPECGLDHYGLGAGICYEEGAVGLREVVEDHDIGIYCSCGRFLRQELCKGSGRPPRYVDHDSRAP